MAGLVVCVRGPILEAGPGSKAVRQPVRYGEAAAAFELSEDYYHLSAKDNKVISTFIATF